MNRSGMVFTERNPWLPFVPAAKVGAVGMALAAGVTA
jgi:hypothetical protein